MKSLTTLFSLGFALFVLLSTSSEVIAQKHSFCGTMPPHKAKSENPDSLVFDRFGNSYDLNHEFIVNKSASMSTLAGYFNLDFDVAITQEQQDVIIFVFEELTSLIDKPTLADECGFELPNHPVNISINSKNDNSSLSLASGTPLYYNSFLPEDCESQRLVESRVLTKLNGGYTNDSSIDGIITVNQAHLSDLGFAIPPNGPEPNLFDFYTIIWHEILHVMAFHSENAFLFYSDTEQIDLTPLDLLTSDLNGNNIMSNDCVGNCWELDYTLFPEQSIPGIEIYLDPCTMFVGSVPLGDGLVQDINTLSHLGTTPPCGNPDYLMGPNLLEGVRKIISQDEVDILCAYGYNTTSCPSECYVYTTGTIPEQLPLSTNGTWLGSLCNDITYYTCDDQFDIYFEDLYSYIYSTADDAEIEFISLESLNGATVTNFSDHFHVEDEPDDISVSRYQFTLTIMMDEECRCKTYDSTVFITFDNQCPEDYCDTEECNFLCVDDFDDLGNIQPGINRTDLGIPFMFETNSTPASYHDLYDVINDNLGLRGNEGSAFVITDKNKEDCQYTLKFDAIKIYGNSGTSKELNIWVSGTPPCHPNDQLIPRSCGITTHCENYNFSPLCLTSVQVSSGSYQTFEIEIDYNEFIDNFNYIVFEDVGDGTMVYDNFSLTKKCGDADFDLIKEDCDTYDLCPTTKAYVSFHWEITNLDNGSVIFDEHIEIGEDGKINDFVFPMNGTYEIILTITDQCGNSADMVQEVEIFCESTCVFDESAVYIEPKFDGAFIYPCVSEIGGFLTSTFELMVLQENGDWITIGPITSHVHSLKVLESCTAQAVRIRKMCEDGSWSNWSSEFIFTTSCCINDAENTTIIAYEQAAHIYPCTTEEGGYLLSTFEIQWRELGQGAFQNIGPITNVGYTLSGLVTCSEYEIRVRKLCENDTWSEWSSTIIFSTACCEYEEGNVVVDAQETYAYIYPCNYMTSTFEIRWRITGGGWMESGEVTSHYYLLNNLESCSEYEYMVRKKCETEGWSAWSNAGSFQTDCCGLAYMNLTIDEGLESITLYPFTEDDGSFDSGIFQIFWRPFGGTWNNTGPLNGSEYTIEGLEECTDYQFRIRVKCADGWSAWGPIDILSTDCPPPVLPDYCGCDFVFLIDKSGSIDEEEYEDIECSILVTISEIETACGACNSRFSIVSFANEGGVQIDSQFDCNPPENIGEDINGGTNVSSGLGGLLDALGNGDLESDGEVTDSTCLKVFIYTDAKCDDFIETFPVDGDNLSSAEIAIILEQQYGAEISVIHYNNINNEGNISNDISDCDEVTDTVSEGGEHLESDLECNGGGVLLGNGILSGGQLGISRKTDSQHFDNNAEGDSNQQMLEAEYLFMFPNPATDIVVIKCSADSSRELVVVNLEGKELKRMVLLPKQDQLELDVSIYASGIYFLLVQEIQSGKILQQTKFLKI